jgi:hypothetical protein
MLVSHNDKSARIPATLYRPGKDRADEKAVAVATALAKTRSGIEQACQPMVGQSE